MVKGRQWAANVRDRCMFLLGSGKSPREVVKQVKHEHKSTPSRSVIQHWAKFKAVSSKRGRRHKNQEVRKTQEAKIERYLRRHDGQAIASDIINDVEWEPSLPQSLSSKYRFINSMKSCGRAVPIRTYTLTRNDKAHRTKYAKSHKGESMGEWHFQDEAAFTLCGRRNRSVVYLRSRGKPVKPKDTHTSIRVMIWGCFGTQGKNKMQRLDRALTGQAHLELLKEYFADGAPVGTRLIQDNARPHIAKVVRLGMKDLNVEIDQLPRRTPQCNPHERVWSRMKDIVYKNNRTYTSLAALDAAILSAWQVVIADHAYIDSIIADLQKRYTELIRKRGGYI